MMIPKYIADKVIQYNKAKQKAESLYNEVEKYLEFKGLAVEGVYDLSVEDAPRGDPQDYGEYCDQTEYFEDFYRGTYYWPINGGKYLAGKFDC